MFFSLVFLLTILAYGPSEQAFGNSQVFGKRVSLAKPSTPDCKSVGHPYKAANQIHEAIFSASKGGLAKSQFAFIYTHGTTPAVNFDNVDVQSVLAFESKTALPFVSDVWPADAATTNFMLAVPSAPAFGGGMDYSGHAENKLLQKFDTMQGGYLKRSGNECPCYVILGTMRDPCNFKNKKGCAVEYVKTRNAFTEYCPNTAFFLFVHRKVEPKFEKFWQDTMAMMEMNNIQVLYNGAI